MALLVVLVAAVVVVVLVVRAASAPGGANRGRVRAPRPPRNREPQRTVGPDDDPEFLRELQRRARRDDSPA